LPSGLFKQKVSVLGTNYDVHSLFQHLNLKLEPANSFLLESIEGRNRPVYSFIALEPDYILSVKNSRARLSDVRSEAGEKLRNLPPKMAVKGQIQTTVQDRVENRIEALDTLATYIPEGGPA